MIGETAYERTARALTNATGYTPPNDKGDWRCPAHPDSTPSLSMSVGRNGSVILHCQAGCDHAAVMAAIGLKDADLYDQPTSNGNGGGPQITAVYPYTDETGELLFQAVRYEPKDFRQRQPDGKGGWIWSLKGVRRVLYRLAVVLEAAAAGGEVFVVEGEKDVEALELAGHVATCNPMGAGKWSDDYSASLKGARVFVVADRDEPGYAHARMVAASLRRAGVDVVAVTEPAKGKDAAEHLGMGLTVDDFVQVRDEEIGDISLGGPQPIDWETFWTQERVETDWMVEPILPAGRQVAMYSPPKTGKSLLALEVAAAVATGRPVLLRPAGEPVDVVYIDMEMTTDDLMERLTDFGYGPDNDLSHLHYYLLQDLPPLDTPEGGEVLVKLVERHRADLVVLDTMARVVEGDENDANTYRGFYRNTGMLLKSAGVCLWRLDHSGKEAGKGQRGSSAKADDVDVVFRMTLDTNTVTLKRTHSRVPWVPENIRLTRETEPDLRHVAESSAWHPGVDDVGFALDCYGVPVDATCQVAMAFLKAHGEGKRKAVVAEALRWRRCDEGRAARTARQTGAAAEQIVDQADLVDGELW